MPFDNVLLIHGLGSTYDRNWRRPGWVEVLEFEGLAPHGVALPGHDGAELDHTASEAVLRVARSFTEPVAAVGFSAGAIALLHAAADEPSRFSRIVAMGIGDHVMREPMTSAHLRGAALRSSTPPEGPSDRVLWTSARHSGNDVEKVASYLDTADLCVPEERLHAITCPALVVVGSRDEVLPASGLVDAFPDARLIVLDGVDHVGTPSAIQTIDAVTLFLAGR